MGMPAVLNTRDVKALKEQLIRQFGYAPEGDYAYLQTESKRIFLINKDLQLIDLRQLRVDRIGLYFAELMKDRTIRLSKEGAQLLVEQAGKNKKELVNTVSLAKEEVRSYFQGNSLEKDLGAPNRLVLLLYGDDCLGCAKYKEGTILNFLPKIHRGEVIV